MSDGTPRHLEFGYKLYCAPPGWAGPDWGHLAGAYPSIAAAAEAAMPALPFDPAGWAADPADPDRVFWPRRDMDPSAAGRTRWTITGLHAASQLARLMAVTVDAEQKVGLATAWLHTWAGAAPLTRTMIKSAVANTHYMLGETPSLSLEAITSRVITGLDEAGATLAPGTPS